MNDLDELLFGLLLAFMALLGGLLLVYNWPL